MTKTQDSMTQEERMQAFWFITVLTVCGWALWGGVLMHFGWIAEGVAGAPVLGLMIALVACGAPLLCPDSWGRAALRI